MDMRATEQSLVPAASTDSPADDTTKLPLADLLDHSVLSSVSRMTGGASHLAFATAGFEWLTHLALLPGTQMTLAYDGAKVFADAFRSSADDIAEQTPEDLPTVLGHMPAKYLGHVFDGMEGWVDKAAYAVPGVSKKHKDLVRFAAHQSLEPFRPENWLLTNPEAMDRTFEDRGSNLVRGYFNFLSDSAQAANILPEADNTDGPYVVGETLAVTPGKVVYRNRLIELIQYEPKTEHTRPEPVLITPAWIMKYYILDLSPHNSLVDYLVKQGFTVYMISWKNPDREDADLGFDDYRQLGVISALDAITDITKAEKIHTVGYCLGGTLLSITAAALERDGDDRIASITLLAAQIDFREAGELSLFIDEDQLNFLEASMNSTGYLEAEQMASAFSILRSRDLIWRRNQRAYLLGERPEGFDLMAWNADATRMPPRMHSEYLRRLYLNNDFINGQLYVDEKPVAVSDIRAPLFALGTEKDHVAPWRSVYKIHLFADSEVTFVLANGGHNAGVVSEVGRPRRHHRVLTKQDQEYFIPPDQWTKRAHMKDGSWWPTWADWLIERSSPLMPAPASKRAKIESNELPAKGKLPEAPGSYVLAK